MRLFGFTLLVALLLLGKFIIWPYLKISFSAMGMMFKKGTDEVQDYLCENAVDGEVPENVQVNAYRYLIEKGYSDREASNFVLATSMQISQGALKAHRKIHRANEKIKDLSTAELWVMNNTDPVTSAEAIYDIEQEKERQQAEIEKQKSKLNLD